jgi:hypothetical protein
VANAMFQRLHLVGSIVSTSWSGRAGAVFIASPQYVILAFLILKEEARLTWVERSL